MWRVVVAVGLVLGLAVVVTPEARACSCVAWSPAEHLEQADGAFIGRLIAREDGGGFWGPKELTWTFEVEQAIKGELGETVDVLSAVDGAACGLDGLGSGRIGMFLFQRDGEWHSSSCSLVDPDALLRAIEPPPEPDGSGPVAVLVADRFESARIVALDEAGRTLAYGYGEGETRALSVCPGSENVVELVALRGGESRRLEVRNLRSFEVVREVELPNLSSDVLAIACRDRSGSEVLIADSVHTRQPPTGRLGLVKDGEYRTLYSAPLDPHGGNHAIFDIDNGRAYITKGSHGHEISVIDLVTGEESQVITFPYAGDMHGYLVALALSPDGTTLAALVHPNGGPVREHIAVADITAQPVEVRELPLGQTRLFSNVFWLDSQTFLVSGEDYYPDGAPVYDVALNQVTSIPGWSAATLSLAGDTLYGVGGYGRLISAPLPDGPAVTLRQFDNPNVTVFAAVPGEIVISPQVVPTPVVTTTVPDAGLTPASVAESTAEVDVEPTPPSDVDPEVGSDSGLPGWWFGIGIVAVIAGGGWGVYRLRGR